MRWCLPPDVLRDKSGSGRRGKSQVLVLIPADRSCLVSLSDYVYCFILHRRNQLYTNYYSADEINGDEMGGSCGTVEKRNGGNLKETKRLE